MSIYDKTHLVPFGEYVPLARLADGRGDARFFASCWMASMPGRSRLQRFDAPQAPDFLPLICYEIIFPGRVANLRRRPGWFVNVTNDAWFGESTGPHQHLHQARIRATEEGLPVMRAANTGISAVIDPLEGF